MTIQQLVSLFKERILLLDGAMGTMIQSENLSESDFRGDIFAGSRVPLKGNNDLLVLTRPDVIDAIHTGYMSAGSDIISTDTFNANAVSMSDYGLEEMVPEINRKGAVLARRSAERFMAEHPDRRIFVAGSIGPTNKTVSMSPDVNDPAHRDVTYDVMYQAYLQQVDSLVEGGVDLLLFETIFDTLNLKAGLDAAEHVSHRRGIDMPVMLSLTLSGKDGRTFSGQTFSAFIASVSHVRSIVSVGLNCSFGAADMLPHLRELAKVAPYFITAYPNAGLPDTFGRYAETPDSMAEVMRRFVDEGLVNAIGGCCGTTPDHIRALRGLVGGRRVHEPAARSGTLTLSGLDALSVTPDVNFINVGERCNVAGSRRFLRLIKDKKYDEAVSVARRQVEDGAQIIDINMDDGLLDASEEMVKFLNFIASEPEIARVPVMIDSSRWEVINAGLKCCQGKSVVNSISLKEGEQVFLERAAAIRRFGAAVIVMAFDEQGQADTYERKTDVCARAYGLLRDRLDFNPCDIIFDPNILAIATGIKAHDRYAADFIRAVSWIKANLPGTKVSGGVSNLSFAFRGNNYVREAMHAVFLYHAIAAGMDMGIVNPATSVQYDDIPGEFRDILEDAILARDTDACDRLIGYAQRLHGDDTAVYVSADLSLPEWRRGGVADRLRYALVKGIGDYLESDIQEALAEYGSAVKIIDGPLMDGMKTVGELFGDGKMFLPQVVKTARTMKRAVAILQPELARSQEKEDTVSAGTVLLATVKGDVHDIGKNIVGIILACNNFKVIDLGVMVDAETIVDEAIKNKVDVIGLSGLITPSLDEMCHVVEALGRRGVSVPVLIGGATTSRVHTAVKIAPLYRGTVIHVNDASRNPVVAARLLNPEYRDGYISEVKRDYDNIRQMYRNDHTGLVAFDVANTCNFKIDWKSYVPVIPDTVGRIVLDLPLLDVAGYINWGFFFVAWKFGVKYASVASVHDCDGCRETWIASFPEEEKEKASQAVRLYRDARDMLQTVINEAPGSCKAVVRICKANSDGNNIILDGETIPVLRQQAFREDGVYKSLSDFVIPEPEGRTDYIGAFAVTVDSMALRRMADRFKTYDDNYSSVLLQTLTDRLAEASSEYLHRLVRTGIWGYAPEENLTLNELFASEYQGIRPAVGYPSLPDQQLIFTLDRLLDLGEIGITLTGNGAMCPNSSVCGLYFANPESRYFMIGNIGDDQLSDYASRRGVTKDAIRKFLGRNL